MIKSAVLFAIAKAIALHHAKHLNLSGVAWVACFSQPILLGINAGLTIEPLAQPTVTSTQALCPRVKWVALLLID